MKSFNDYQKDLNEADFGSMAAQLKKYGGKDNVKDAPKAPQARSKYAPDYTMTGHKEKTTSTGKQYSKVLPDYDDEDDVKSAKKSVATGAAPQEKRGRGRPKGVGAKAGQYKPRDPAKKAESAAKAAATKAANKAKKAALTNEDCEEIFEGLTFDDMIEFMIDEEVVALDELNKSTLGSYIKKATMDVQSLDETSEIKVGSIVTPKIGPHAGKPHTVIHVHENGTFNIKPNIDVRKVKYHLGVARCSRADLKESHKDEFSLEELALFIESEEFNSLDENELALFEGIFNESSDAVVKDKSGKVIKFKHTGDWEKKKEDPIVDKSGAKHTAHSRVRDLARNAIKRVGKSEISFAKNESEESLSKEVKVPHDGAMNPTKIHMSHVDDLVKSGKYKYFSAHGAPGYPASILRHVASGKKVNISTGNRDHSTFTHVHRVLESEKTGTKPAINDAVAYYAKNINTNLIKE